MRLANVSLRRFSDIATEHTGYYPKGAPVKSNQEAQIDMIEESLKVGDFAVFGYWMLQA